MVFDHHISGQLVNSNAAIIAAIMKCPQNWRNIDSNDEFWNDPHPTIEADKDL